MTRLDVGLAVRAAVTYTIASFVAAAAATVATLPLGDSSQPVVSMVWISTVATVGFPAVLLCDRITFGRKGGRR